MVISPFRSEDRFPAFQFLNDGLPEIHHEPVQTADIHVQPPFLPELSVQNLTLDSRYSLVPQLVPCLPFSEKLLQILILGPAVREVAIPLVEPGRTPGGPLGTVKVDHHVPAVKNLPIPPALGQRGKGHGLGSVHTGDDNMHMQLQSWFSFIGFCLASFHLGVIAFIVAFCFDAAEKVAI